MRGLKIAPCSSPAAPMASAPPFAGGWRRKAASSGFSTWTRRRARRSPARSRRPAGGRAFTLRTSATTTAVKRAVEGFEAASGPVSFLVNNAGWDRAASFPRHSTPEFWSKVIAINLHGPLNMSHVVLKAWRRAALAASSTSPPTPGESAPRAKRSIRPARAASSRFTKTAGARTGRQRHHPQHALPRADRHRDPKKLPRQVRTALSIAEALKRAIPMRRFGAPEDYPGLVAFLLSDDAAYITGQTISVSGGLTMHG